MYEHPSNKKARPTSVTGSIVKSKIADVDACTSWTVNFTEHLQAQAILSCSMTVPTASFGATIRYKNGTITVKPPIFCSPSFTVQYFDSQGDVVREETKTFKYTGGGWHYEADEVARCIRDGKLESDLWGHEKSIIVMETFDKVSTCYFSLQSWIQTCCDIGPPPRQVRLTARCREGGPSTVKTHISDGRGRHANMYIGALIVVHHYAVLQVDTTCKRKSWSACVLIVISPRRIGSDKAEPIAKATARR